MLLTHNEPYITLDLNIFESQHSDLAWNKWIVGLFEKNVVH